MVAIVQLPGLPFRITVFSCVALLALSAPILVHAAGPLVTQGPYGGSASLLNHPPGSDTLFAATYGGGFFESVDRGLTWHQNRSGLATSNLFCVTADPFEDRLLFVGGARTIGEPLYRSTDRGRTWVAAVTGLPPAVAAIRVLTPDPHTPGRLYAGAQLAGAPYSQGRLFRSDDRGQNWVKVEVDTADLFGGMNNYITAIQVSPRSPDVIYTGWWGGEVKRTGDGGASWSNCVEGGRWGSCMGLSFADSSDTSLVLTAGVILKTWNSGLSWTQIDSSLVVFGVRQCFKSDPADSAVRYVSVLYDKTYVTRDAGYSWQSYCDSLQTRQLFFSGNGSGREILAADTRKAVVRSVDDFATYQEWNNGITALGNYSLVFDPLTPMLYVASSPRGVHRSRNSGAAWQSLEQNLGLQVPRALMTDPRIPGRVYAAGYQPGNAIFRSDDSGSTWTALGLPSGNFVYCMTMHPDSSNVLLVGGNGGVVITRDGEAWSAGTLPPSSAPIYCLRWDPADHQVIYAGSNSSTNGALRSVTGGQSWTGLGLAKVQAIAVGPPHSQVLLAGEAGTGADTGLWRSENAGASWTRVALQGVRVLAIEFQPDDSSHVYAGTLDHGLWASNDGGVSWQQTEVDSEVVRAIAFIPSGSSMTARADALRRGAQVGNMQPLLSPGLYLATDSRGVLMYSPATSSAGLPGRNDPPRFSASAASDADGATIWVVSSSPEPETKIQVFDVLGRLISNLYHGPLDSGRTSFHWAARRPGEGRASAGQYFVRVQAGSHTVCTRVLVIH